MPNTSLESITLEAMKLSSDERTELADRLWLSLANQEEHRAAWDAEIQRRIGQLERSEVVSRPWDEVIQGLRAKSA